MHRRVKAPNGRQQGLRQAVALRNQIGHRSIFRRAVHAKRGVLESGRQKIPLQQARVKGYPIIAGIGQTNGCNPTIFQAPRGQRRCLYRQCWQQGIQLQITTQIDARDAGDGFYCA